MGKSIKEVRSTTAGHSPPPPLLSSEMIEMARSRPCCLKILRWPHEDCVLLGTWEEEEDHDGRIGDGSSPTPTDTSKYIYMGSNSHRNQLSETGRTPLTSQICKKDLHEMRNHRKKKMDMWRLNILLRNQRVNSEVKEEIGKYLETNK